MSPLPLHNILNSSCLACSTCFHHYELSLNISLIFKVSLSWDCLRRWWDNHLGLLYWRNVYLASLCLIWKLQWLRAKYKNPGFWGCKRPAATILFARCKDTHAQRELHKHEHMRTMGEEAVWCAKCCCVLSNACQPPSALPSLLTPVLGLSFCAEENIWSSTAKSLRAGDAGSLLGLLVHSGL